MVIETDTPSFLEWFLPALLAYGQVLGALVGGGLVAWWLIASLRYGPKRGCVKVTAALAAVLPDLTQTSFRRVWALSWLAVKESIRRRAVVVFAVFIVVLLFAGWFLDPDSDHPATLYMRFVIDSTSYLMLALALLISALSLPKDFKDKTLHTVVTKPVRPGEIVLGRVVGFTIITTGLLVVMGTISYVFVIRGLAHTHQVDPDDLARAEESLNKMLAGGDVEPLTLRTTRVHNHSHDFHIAPVERISGDSGTEIVLKERGRARTTSRQDHWHDLSYETSTEPSGGKTTVRIAAAMGSPQGRLIARVPIYGKIRFKNRAGDDAEKGVNVGDEWTYRSFIAGGTRAAAIWTFGGMTEANFPDDVFPQGLPLEMTIEVFRTHKGKTDDPTNIPGIPGSLALRNPDTGLTGKLRIFTANDFTTTVEYLPRKLQTPEGTAVDLFDDLATEDGRIEVVLRCEKGGQFFGAAQADVYFHARDASFTLNFIKGYLGIWIQMVLLIGIGVTVSTLLSAPIALLTTFVVLIVGLWGVTFMSDLGASQFMPMEDLKAKEEYVWGGGPLEALYRLVQQQNVTSEMEPGTRTTVMKTADQVLGYSLFALAKVLPEFGQFSFADRVASGFDIPAEKILIGLCRMLGYLVPLLLAGYLFLKMREVAR
ncbi:MAG TPA: hypothetical protein VMY42_19275 [Thermoguttaceae bacterium]|nr:hypothetical protein [Thermoguttaceae bacterium]